MIAIDISKFGPKENFILDVQEYISFIKGSKKKKQILKRYSCQEK